MMMKELNNRSKLLLNLLLKAKKEQSINYLTEKLQVSARTIRADILKLNDILKNEQIQIINHRNKGYLIVFKDESARKKLATLLVAPATGFKLDTTKNRIIYLLKELLQSDQYRSVGYLMDHLFVSRNTLYLYLKDIRSLLKEYNLTLKTKANLGFKLTGKEINKRQLVEKELIDLDNPAYVLSFTETEQFIFDNLNLNYLQKKSRAFLIHNFPNLPDVNQKNVILHLAIALSRDRSSNFLTHFAFSYQPNNDNVLKILNFLIKLSQHFQVVFNFSEINYLLFNFVSNKVLLNNNKMELKNDRILITKSINEFLDKIYQNFHFNLKHDQILISNLTDHLLSMVNIYKNQGRRDNPLLKTIISTFPLAFDITLSGAKILEKNLNIKLDHNEISFITLHIGAAIERNFNNEFPKRKVALICGSGTATASLLEAKLNNSFGQYLKISGKYALFQAQQEDLSDNDFLISTVPLVNAQIPVVLIDLFHFKEDAAELMAFLATNMNEQERIMHLFNEKLTITLSNTNNRFTILKDLAHLLEKNKIVSSGYEASVIKREKIATTAIGGGIAIPHPLSWRANKSRVAFAKLESPLMWDQENKVQFIFMLAINKNDYEKTQKLYDFLLYLQNNNNLKNILKKTNNPKELIAVIRSAIQNSTQKL